VRAYSPTKLFKLPQSGHCPSHLHCMAGTPALVKALSRHGSVALHLEIDRIVMASGIHDRYCIRFPSQVSMNYLRCPAEFASSASSGSIFETSDQEALQLSGMSGSMRLIIPGRIDYLGRETEGVGRKAVHSRRDRLRALMKAGVCGRYHSPFISLPLIPSGFFGGRRWSA